MIVSGEAEAPEPSEFAFFSARRLGLGLGIALPRETSSKPNLRNSSFLSRMFCSLCSSKDNSFSPCVSPTAVLSICVVSTCIFSWSLSNEDEAICCKLAEWPPTRVVGGGGFGSPPFGDHVATRTFAGILPLPTLSPLRSRFGGTNRRQSAR